MKAGGALPIHVHVYDAITVTTYCPVNLTYNYLEKLQDSLSDIITQILRLYALQVQLKSRKHNVPKINKRNNVSTQTGSGCFLFNNLYTSLFVYSEKILPLIWRGFSLRVLHTTGKSSQYKTILLN